MMHLLFPEPAKREELDKLFKAVAAGRRSKVAQILDHGADVDAKDKDVSVAAC